MKKQVTPITGATHTPPATATTIHQLVHLTTLSTHLSLIAPDNSLTLADLCGDHVTQNPPPPPPSLEWRRRVNPHLASRQ